jgi:rod shape-determining protein MreC
MLWRYIPAQWWQSWGPLVTTSSIAIALLILGDRVQFSVVRGLRSTVLYPASAIDATFRDLWEVRRENERLRLELAETRMTVQQLSEFSSENERLAQLLDFQSAHTETLLATRVVGRGRDGVRDWSYLTVRARIPDSMQSREIVAITPEGLVGQVVERSLGFIVVRSLASPRSAIHVVDQRSRVAGVVRSEGDVGSRLRMDHVPVQEDVQVGDTLVTSGQGVIYPRGIPVGRVVRVESRGDELIKRVWIEPFVQFSRLEEIFLTPGEVLPE